MYAGVELYAPNLTSGVQATFAHVSTRASLLTLEFALTSDDACCFIDFGVSSEVAGLPFRRRGTLSLQPKGRPAFSRFLGSLLIANGCVSSFQVRPVQMSRMVFSFTPYSLATKLAFGFPEAGDMSSNLKISRAFSLHSLACGFEHWLCALVDFIQLSF